MSVPARPLFLGHFKEVILDTNDISNLCAYICISSLVIWSKYEANVNACKHACSFY